MRLVFDESGVCREFYKVTPSTPGPAAPWVTIDVEHPDYFVEGVSRAVAQGRVTYSGGVRLDGRLYTPPVIRTPVSYGEALAYIQSATSISQLREILYRVCDGFLGTGALEL